jgi:[ribosomal protein S18]-alanine N-acetyltransferase
MREGEARADWVEIRPAKAADLEAIAAIQNAAPDASHWEPSDYLAHDCWVATSRAAIGSNGSRRVVGFLLSRPCGPGEREILNLAVDPANRRRGVARRLLKAELERGRGAWFLEVRESNKAALLLYESFGFQPVGIRDAYYHDPPESGIVMRFLS